MDVDGISIAKAQAIEDASIVSGAISPITGHLILTTAGGAEIDAGLVTNESFEGTLAEFNAAMTDADFVSLVGAETLTNKDMTAASNSFPGNIVKMVAKGWRNTPEGLTSAETLFEATDDAITLEQGATYKIIACCDVSSDTAGGVTVFRIRHDVVDTGVTGSVITLWPKDHRVATRAEGMCILGVMEWTDPDLAGVFFKLTFDATIGQSEIPTTYTPANIIVERIS
jgi:hypothetical protein